MPIVNVARRGGGRSRVVGYVSPLVFVRRAAIYRGFIRGRKGWLAIGLLLWTPRVAKKVFGRKEEYVTTEVLRSGQFVRLQSIPPTTRRQRKAARRAR